MNRATTAISVSHNYGCDELNCFLLGNVFWYDQNLKGSIAVPILDISKYEKETRAQKNEKKEACAHANRNLHALQVLGNVY